MLGITLDKVFIQEGFILRDSLTRQVRLFQPNLKWQSANEYIINLSRSKAHQNKGRRKGS